MGEDDFAKACNAKYHSRQTEESKMPTTAWKKEAIRTWLREHCIAYQDKDTVPILLNLSKAIFVPKEYALESITKKYCSETNKDVKVLRLPVGHSEINPVELIWAQAKNEVARKNVKFNITSVRELTITALNNVTPANWTAAVKHVIKVEDAFRKVDFGDEKNVPQIDNFVIHVSFDESESSESEPSYDEDECEDD